MEMFWRHGCSQPAGRRNSPRCLAVYHRPQTDLFWLAELAREQTLTSVYFRRRRLHAMPLSPARPEASSSKLDGSGTASSCPRGARPSPGFGKEVCTVPPDIHASSVLTSMPGPSGVTGNDASVKPDGVEMKKSNVPVRGLMNTDGILGAAASKISPLAPFERLTLKLTSRRPVDWFSGSTLFANPLGADVS